MARYIYSVKKKKRERLIEAIVQHEHDDRRRRGLDLSAGKYWMRCTLIFYFFANCFLCTFCVRCSQKRDGESSAFSGGDGKRDGDAAVRRRLGPARRLGDMVESERHKGAEFIQLS